ncbi:MAG: bis(5'-nucleosyl)-tetraphosphatase (symmetrical) YqeK [Spirochaetales bacterium]|nr:bis(5'-nucleosyl)-tetraphosphatase (symmetrical) YqeK [Spirochaetales bacterium]
MINRYESILAYIKKNLSKKRRKHSIHVSILAESLCKRYDIEPGKGLVTGISHDIAREFDKDKMVEYAKKDGNPLYPWEEKHPILLHGRAGAEYIKERWDITDPWILDAIRFHTYGKPGMGILAKILFIADYLEPGRNFLEEKEREEILDLRIDAIMLYVLKGKFAYLKKKGREILQTSLLLYKELANKTGEINEKKNIG